VGDGAVCVGQVKTVRFDVGKAGIHVHAPLRFVGVHCQRFERGPRTVLRRKVLPTRIGSREAEDTARSPENMNLYGHSPLAARSN